MFHLYLFHSQQSINQKQYLQYIWISKNNNLVFFLLLTVNYLQYQRLFVKRGFRERDFFFIGGFIFHLVTIYFYVT